MDDMLIVMEWMEILLDSSIWLFVGEYMEWFTESISYSNWHFFLQALDQERRNDQRRLHCFIQTFIRRQFLIHFCVDRTELPFIASFTHSLTQLDDSLFIMYKLNFVTAWIVILILLFSGPEKKDEKKTKWVETVKVFVSGCTVHGTSRTTLNISAETTCQANCLRLGGNAINYSKSRAMCQCRLCQGTPPTPSHNAATGWVGYYVE